MRVAWIRIVGSIAAVMVGCTVPANVRLAGDGSRDGAADVASDAEALDAPASPDAQDARGDDVLVDAGPDAVGVDGEVPDTALPDIVLVDATDARDTSTVCTSASDCSDGVYCTGAERCMPGAVGADARGCLPAAMPACNVATQLCSEALGRCLPLSCTMPDRDGDAHLAIACGGDDCDDYRDTINPARTETCNGFDDNCSGQIDEGFPRMTYYYDADGDQYGNPSTGVLACAAPLSYVLAGGDCNDVEETIYPGHGCP